MDDRLRHFPREDRSWLATAVLCVGVVFCGWLVATAIFHSSVDSVLGGLAGLVVITKVVLDEAQGIVVDRAGVHRPLRRVLRWQTVEGVFPGDVWLSLRCTDRNYRHARLPTRYAADVARVGRKPLQTGPPPAGEPHLHDLRSGE
ncbi:hypothetical protein [Allobranchiibius sp. GilTou73]|uniref:hypothetical protein n=1 Tax=Allobranchiibius sp. GilTou73 TaxID=2904523 RepID=UPI001F32B44C|nr:hypothetical protein [Allobranchiibius sp. GilTou73]UIJ33804.1 hypothetical protein LVQ62_11650 [Allobranchiibius sp. GilTou73]